MPVVSSTVSKLTYLARELTPGTRAAPNKYLHGLNLRIVGNSTRGEVRPSGSTLRTSRPLIQDWSTFTIGDGSYLDYNSLLYPLGGLLGVPTISTPGGGTLSREQLFQYTPDGSNVRPAFTFGTGYKGTGGTFEETIRNIFQSFNFGFSRGAAPTIGGGGYGRSITLNATPLAANEVQLITLTPTGATGGTFTLTYAGQTTTTLAFGVTAGAMQTALEALSNLAPGDVTVTGAAPAYTLTFGGTLANTNVAALTGDGTLLTGPDSPYTVVVTTPTPGAATIIPVKAIEAPEWTVYLDATPGAIGTTKVRPYTGEFTFSGLTNPDWVIDAAQSSYDDDVLQVPTLTANLVMRNDATSRALYPLLLAGATYYMRYQAIGPIIEGSLHYEFRLDVAVQASENLGQFGDEGGSETMPFPFTIVSDSSFASGGFTALLRNTLTDF